jgi:hypothetical protein
VWFFNLNAVFPDEHTLPGAPPVLHTPVLAEYSGEQLVVFGEGGASWLESVIGFPLSARSRDTRAWGPEIPQARTVRYHVHRRDGDARRIPSESRVSDLTFEMAAFCASCWSAIGCLDGRTKNLSMKERLKTSLCSRWSAVGCTNGTTKKNSLTRAAFSSEQYGDFSLKWVCFQKRPTRFGPKTAGQNLP